MSMRSSGFAMSAWCQRIWLVLTWALMSSDFTPPPFSAMTIETEPFGPITSFTKNAVSLIIGPQPASYQPTEPSSKATWRTP